LQLIGLASNAGTASGLILSSACIVGLSRNVRSAIQTRRSMMTLTLVEQKPVEYVVVCKNCDKIIYRDKTMKFYYKLFNKTKVQARTPTHIARVHMRLRHKFRVIFWEIGTEEPPEVREFEEKLR
jgi:hypothetical protein